MRRTSSWRTCRQCRRSTDPPGEASSHFNLMNIHLSGQELNKKNSRFWIMLEKEFKDDPDKLVGIFTSQFFWKHFHFQVSSVCKFDSSTGNLSYCGTICLQVWFFSCLQKIDFAHVLTKTASPDERGGHLEANHRVLLHDPLQQRP